MGKQCIKCNINKPMGDFHKSCASPDGHINTCKLCKKEYNKKYKDTTKKESDKKYYEKNKEKIRETQKKYKNNNKEKITNLNKNWAINNPNKIKESAKKATKKWRENNPSKSKESLKKYYLKNKYRNAYRYILKNSLKRFGEIKEGHTIELLGYSALELKEYIESLFTEGMSWDNYGEWHIDHIRPIASFERGTPMNIVNRLINLQPLWATTREINGVIYIGNLNKGSNYIKHM